MEVHDEFISEEVFGECLDRLPQTCVEVCLERDGAVLVARRTNEPAEREWFWPGARLYKGERLDDAARRVGREELGVTVKLVGRVGVYSHFWDRSSVEGADSRHTVNVVYHVRQRDPDETVTLDDQHDAYRFVASDAGGNRFVDPDDGTVSNPDPHLHEYVRRYLSDYDFSR